MNKSSEIHKCLTEVEIKNYLSETLSYVDRFRVEDHLLDCPLCADAVEGIGLHQNADQEINLDKLDRHFESKMKKEEALVKPLKPRSPFTINRIAAAVLLLLVPVAAWMYRNSDPNQKLYADFKPDQIEPIALVRSGDAISEMEAPMQYAKSLFAEKRYTASLEASELVLQKLPEHSLATYYAGLSAMESGHTALARNYLSSLRINDADFYEDATWYLVLTEVRAGEKENVSQLLDELLQRPQGMYYARAKELKGKM